MMLALIVRNCKVYTRDKMAFFMSFLSGMILILVYQVFLGQIQIDAIKATLHRESVSGETIQMVNLWLIAGLTTIVSMTSTLSALGVMVADREKKVSEDFRVSPISNNKIDWAYALFAVLFGMVMTMFSCVFAICLFNGVSALQNYSMMDYLRIMGIISLGTILSATLMLPVLTFIHSSTAFTTLSTIVGTFIGFISGVYLSIGSVGDTLQRVMTWFPLTQVNSLLKQVLMRESLAQVFDQAPLETVTSYQEAYGVVLVNNGGEPLSNQLMLVYLGSVIVGLLILQFVIKQVKKF